MDFDKLLWTLAESATDDYEYWIRIREFPDGFEIDPYPKRINIFWKMAECFANGFPTRDELDKVQLFEDRIIDAVEADNFSVLSVIMTGNEQREFVFHTSDPQEFIDRLTNMPQEQEAYPIEIYSNDDEEWDYYFNELTRIEGVA